MSSGATARETRNLRLTAIRSLFDYAGSAPPRARRGDCAGALDPTQALREAHHHVSHAEEAEALIEAPDRTRWEGRRDRAMLTLAIQAGLRVSELIGLNCADVALGTGAQVHCEGKGRKRRSVPLTASAQAALSSWLRERAGRPQDPLFPTRTRRRLSRDAIERRLATHTANAV